MIGDTHRRFGALEALLAAFIFRGGGKMAERSRQIRLALVETVSNWAWARVRQDARNRIGGVGDALH